MLKNINFTVEVHHPDWLANVVLVQKNNNKWRLCMDFMDLTKACPKDPYPLSLIDLLVDSTVGHELLRFMNAYSVYNQIKMYELDMEATSFVVDRGMYYYKVMPFGHNEGLCRQYDCQEQRNERSHSPPPWIVNLLQKYNIKLNQEKCTFEVVSSKFLGYLVTKRGIEANLDQIKANMEMRSPRTMKEIHSLTGKAAALNWFLSRSTDKCKPFFTAIKKSKLWTDKCKEVFTKLKEYLSKPLLLSKPIDREYMYLYLAVLDYSVSAALIQEDSRE